MTSLAWLYLIAGEVVALLVMNNEALATQIQSRARNASQYRRRRQPAVHDRSEFVIAGASAAVVEFEESFAALEAGRCRQ
jgi:hypothetical protein